MGKRTGRDSPLCSRVSCGYFGDSAVGERVVFVLCGWSCLCGEASWTKSFVLYRCAHRAALSMSGTN